ncbi:MAG: hypothetical protein NTX40_01760 [Planctomycetota bacterium]|nr:hypothetical protein [Planctomycetota bacterium]
MSQDTSWEMRQGLPGEGRLGVIDAYRLGWRFMKKDFWQHWLLAFVFLLLLMASGFVPFGQFIAGPPLAAGFLYVLMQRIDGRALGVGGLFEGFKQRFAQSIVSLLPVLGVWFVLGIIYMVAYFVLVLPIFMSAGSDKPMDVEAFLSVFIPFMVVVNIVSILVNVFLLFFIFAPLAVWDCPQSGWEAAKMSMRMVRERFWSVLGFGVLGWLIGWLFSLGIIACYIGIFFTAPIAMLWFGSALVYLYRSWTGRPLVQPIAAGGPVIEGGPIPPTDIQPPAYS